MKETYTSNYIVINQPKVKSPEDLQKILKNCKANATRKTNLHEAERVLAEQEYKTWA